MKKTFNQQFHIKKQSGTPVNTLREIARKRKLEDKLLKLRNEYQYQIDSYESVTQVHQEF